MKTKCWIILFSFTLAGGEIGATPLKLAYPAEGTILSAQVGLVLAKTDLLKRHGFEAQVTGMGTGRELKTAMVSGRADVIFTSQTNFVVLLGNGFEAYALGSLGSAGHLALVVPKDSAVRSLADLKGGQIATIYGTSLHQPALEWVREAGLQQDVRVMDLGSHARDERGFKNRRGASHNDVGSVLDARLARRRLPRDQTKRV